MVPGVRAAGLLIVLGWSLLGCPRREEAPPDPVARRANTYSRSAPHRCALTESPFVQATASLYSTSLVLGPDGPRLVGHASTPPESDERPTPPSQIYWRDQRDDASLQSALSTGPSALGWTGRGFVGVAEERATFTDPRFAAPRPVRRLSLHLASTVTLAVREGAVLVGWLKQPRDGAGWGAPWVAMVGPDGELLADPRPLPGARSLRTMQVRWDFGRFVVVGQTADEGDDWSWVLEPDGRDDWEGGGRVVCPLSGCLRVEYRAAPGGQSETLRLTSLVDPASAVDTNIFTNEVQGLVVSGDRLLVLHPPMQMQAGCGVHVYDVGRRTLAYEATREAMTCDAGSAVATPSGFALLEVRSSIETAVHSLACGDGA